MSTELAHVAPTAIQQTAGELADAYKIAEALSRTSFVPQHFRGKPDDGAAAILYGQTIGMDPMTALQNLYVIGGKPALYARPMVGIVLAQGHEIWTEVDTPEKVVVCGRRKGSSNIERSEWTIERAKLAGYTKNAKYQSDPQAMLYARASGDVARKVAPDALLGMAYNVEELEASDIPKPPTYVRNEAQQPAPSVAPPVDEPAPEPIDPDNVIAAMAKAETVEVLASIGQQIVGRIPDDARDKVTAAYKARMAELKAPAPEPEPEPEPTLDQATETLQTAIDAEVVES